MIELLHNYPFWFRAVVAGLCVFAGITAAGLLLITPAKNNMPPAREAATVEAPQSQQLPTKLVAPISQAAASKNHSEVTDALVSYLTYKQRVAELRNRYIEREEFVQDARGKTVSWSGYVHDMKGISSGAKIVISLKPEPKSSEIFFADVPAEMRVKAAALRENDKIIVTGKLDNSMQSIVSVEATEFRRAD